MRELAKRGTWLWLCVALAACGGGAPEEEAPGDEEEAAAGTFWQLEEDSELSATTEPWPPRAGAATLVVAMGPGDWSEDPFGGRVSYRLAPAGGSPGTWQPMGRRGGGEYEVTFAAPVVLPEGDVGIHFRVEGGVFSSPVELTDWQIAVE